MTMGNKKKLADQALYLQQSGDWAGALENWKKLLKKCGSDTNAELQIGNCLVRLARFHDAEELFKRLAGKISGNPSALLGLATVYLRQGDQARAMELLFIVKNKYPHNINALLLLGQQFIKFKQYDVAREFIKGAEEIEPDHPQVRHVCRWLEDESSSVYDQDGLWSKHNHDFMQDSGFIRAYKRGLVATGGREYNWHWRVHTGLWAARSASALEGDFVECGVNRGFLSSAIMEYLDWGRLGKQYYLLDTFEGVDPRYALQSEIDDGVLERSQSKIEKGSYTTNFEGVRENFSEWENVTLIKGSVPDTLGEIRAGSIAFLHLDMNSAEPERATLEFLWDRLVKGAFILMDDYAYKGYECQHETLKNVFEGKSCNVLSLPTGQGLFVKVC